MADRLDDVWTTRDYPLLVEAARSIDAGAHALDVKALGEAAGLDEQTAYLAAMALRRRGLIKGVGYDELPIAVITDISAEAYFLTGLHPNGDDALSALVSALRQAADLTPDADEKSRLRRAADGLLNVSRDVMTGVLTAYISSRVPT